MASNIPAYCSVAWARNKGELLSIVKNIVDLHKLFAIIFDKPDVAVCSTAVNLDGDFQQHMILKMMVLKNHLTVKVHEISFFPLFNL